MERYHVNNNKKGLAWFLVSMGGLLFIFGLVLLIRFLNNDTNTEFSMLGIVLYLFQGLMLAILGAVHLRSGRYYLEWNEEEIKKLKESK